MKYLCPGLPTVYLAKIIRPHQPDKTAGSIFLRQPGQGIGRIAGAEPAFDIGDDNSWMTGLGPGIGKTLRQRGHAGDGLERVLGRNQPPDLIKPKGRQGCQAEIAMAIMGGIE